MKKENIKKLVQLAILIAVVIALQSLGAFIKIPGGTSISLVLVPIVIGAIILGPVGGAILGFVFGAMTLWAGISGTDVFTNILFTTQPFATSLICLAKATLAGLGAGFVYKLFGKKNSLAGSIAAAAAAPIINTGLFILGGLTLVSGTLTTNFISEGTTLVYFLVIGCAGINFIFELAANLVLSPAIHTIVKVVNSSLGAKK